MAAQLHVATSFRERTFRPKCTHTSATVVALFVFHMSVGVGSHHISPYCVCVGFSIGVSVALQ